MPTEIYLLKVGMTMTEGMVSEWYIPDGQQVEKGELLYALETEKVNLDVDAETSGTVKHLVDMGVNLQPGDVVGYIFEPGEEIPSDTSSLLSGSAQPTHKSDVAVPGPAITETVPRRASSSPSARRLAKELGVDCDSLVGTGPGGRIVDADVLTAHTGKGQTSAPAISSQEPVKASPLARRMASELGVDLTRVKGTGPRGRITKEDIEGYRIPAAATSASSAGQINPGVETLIPVKGMRRTIAQRMHSSLQTSAQLTIDMQVEMNDAVRLREQLIKEWQLEGVKPTYTDIVVCAVAKALPKHPFMNSQFRETEIALLADVHVGIAVALPDGLVVPVIRNADRLSLKETARESARLALAAREGKLGLDDYAGGTFTVSSLGMFGVDACTPILNEPQSGILGVNRIYDGVAWQGDQPVKAKRMNLSLTLDHRVLDGAPAAGFLAAVKELLMEPYRLLI